MKKKKTASSFIERLVQRLDRLDREKVGDYLIALAREKGLLENIFNCMQEGLVVINPAGDIVLVNQSAIRLLGLPGGAVGSPYRESIESPHLIDIIKSGFEVPGQALVREFCVVEPSRLWIRLSRSALWDGEGNFRGILLVLSDITRQRRSEQEVTLGERLDSLGQLTAAVAHEIGNPLSALDIHVQLMERQLKDLDSPRKDNLLATTGVIKEEIGRLDDLVSQFLGVLRPESVNLKEEEVKEILEEVIRLVEESFHREGIRITRQFPRREIFGKMDRNLIKQAVLNLLKNAAQAMPRGGDISIRIDADDQYLKISIFDQGTGINQDKIPRIFDPFFTTRETGTGLGLLVVYKVLRQHGGYMEVKSEEGRGTVFTLWLPRRPERIKLLPAAVEDKEDGGR